ncbi:MAG: hypothetical protein A3I24_03665 [Candidatus Harrisonbacteria bacterium RIFCSPLOWO2_02_FULL_41_13b]|uniref:Uncharacterized protein n=1 Tax=Candidatus Harrisonbacteria bacterium RIFCSPLOWO2_02_FULL_41_13b TaxID=1798409 RepID=A0A1G1ZV96_9BACT|nr:MAG: hypothetical protein A3I24_03665 [Candidatus Harrisonbacteria bacterium RIFCSPLOWO2_02_FULL_41_13b]
MKLLPEPGWLRKTCLTTVTILLTFLATSSVWLYVTINKPEFILGINYRINFFYIEITKKFVLEKTINGNSIYFYSDSFNGKPIEIVNEVYIYPILKKAFDDFENFVAQTHKLKKPDKRQRKRIKITFIRPEIYQVRDLAYQQPKSSAFAEVFSRKIFIEIPTEKKGIYNILEEKNTLRHEIFHILSGEYNFFELAPHDDAYEFGSLK